MTGNGAFGQSLAEHPKVDKVGFTGSTEVGQILRKATAGSGKKLSLELGGKSPFVVFDSADLDTAVEGVVDAIYFNQGQVSRVYSSVSCFITCWCCSLSQSPFPMFQCCALEEGLGMRLSFCAASFVCIFLHRSNTAVEFLCLFYVAGLQCW